MRYFMIVVVFVVLMASKDKVVLTAPSPSANLDWDRLRAMGVLDETKEKRPFCNAFTGCGQKRSSWSSREAEFARAAALLRHLEGFDAMLAPMNNDMASYNDHNKGNQVYSYY